MKMLVVVGWEGAKGGEMGPPRGSGGPLPSLRMAEVRGSACFVDALQYAAAAPKLVNASSRELYMSPVWTA